MTAGDKARAAYEKYLSGQAYKEGTAVTGPESAETVDSYRNAAADIAAPRNPEIDSDSYDFQRGGLGASAPEQAQMTGAANAYSQAATRGAQYKVGLGDNQMAYDTAPTQRQIHRGGLGAQAMRLSGMGNTEEANRVYDAIDAGELRDHQRALMPGQLQEQTLGIESKKRLAERERLDAKREAARDDIINTYRAAIEKAQVGDFSGLESVVGSDYNNNVPGFDDGKRVSFLDGNAIAVTDAKGNGMTRPLNTETAIKMLEQGMSRRLSAISSKDWQVEREFQINKGVKESEADYKKRMAKIAEDKEVREREQDKAEWGVGGWRDKYLQTQRAVANARPVREPRQTAGEAFTEKGDALAAVYMKADETGKLTIEQATKRAYQVLSRDPDIAAVRTPPPLDPDKIEEARDAVERKLRKIAKDAGVLDAYNARTAEAREREIDIVLARRYGGQFNNVRGVMPGAAGGGLTGTPQRNLDVFLANDPSKQR